MEVGGGGAVTVVHKWVGIQVAAVGLGRPVRHTDGPPFHSPQREGGGGGEGGACRLWTLSCDFVPHSY